MILQNLLEDKRAEWQKNTQEEILNSLLCKAHRYKSLGHKEDRLVMVFGKSHAGKTTFILSLLGVDETKLDEVNFILRAGVPEGSSSTSTAIIYQHSDDDMFGICERRINSVSEVNIFKCSKEQFIQKVKNVRDEVESGKRKSDNIIYLYLPKCYFAEKDRRHDDISILDVPGYETRNEKERYHTDAILNKYMSISVLNIIVRSINDINDLQYFVAPNHDDATKLTSGKYIIVTTRSYSAENVFKYFMKGKEEREGSFEELLESECQRQFERIFGKKIPKVFPIDIGQSFHTLIGNKIQNEEDREYLIAYRESIFMKIYECIYSKQSNTLVSWVQEVIEDEDYYGDCEIKILDSKIPEIQGKVHKVDSQIEKETQNIERLKDTLEKVVIEKQRLQEIKEDWVVPDFEEIIAIKVKEYRSAYFTEQYDWKVLGVEKSVSAHFANIYTTILIDIISELEMHEGLLEEKEKKEIVEKIEEGEYSFRTELEKKTNKHVVLKVLNPSNKEKIDFGRQLLCDRIPDMGLFIHAFIQNKLNSMIQTIENGDQKRLSILVKENEIKLTNHKKEVNKLNEQLAELEEKKRFIVDQIKRDKEILAEYRKIAKKYFGEQRNQVIECINNASSKDERISYVLFLALITNDYKKIMME